MVTGVDIENGEVNIQWQSSWLDFIKPNIFPTGKMLICSTPPRSRGCFSNEPSSYEKICMKIKEEGLFP